MISSSFVFCFALVLYFEIVAWNANEREQHIILCCTWIWDMMLCATHGPASLWRKMKISSICVCVKIERSSLAYVPCCHMAAFRVGPKRYWSEWNIERCVFMCLLQFESSSRLCTHAQNIFPDLMIRFSVYNRIMCDVCRAAHSLSSIHLRTAYKICGVQGSLSLSLYTSLLNHFNSFHSSYFVIILFFWIEHVISLFLNWTKRNHQFDQPNEWRRIFVCCGENWTIYKNHLIFLFHYFVCVFRLLIYCLHIHTHTIVLLLRRIRTCIEIETWTTL